VTSLRTGGSRILGSTTGIVTTGFSFLQCLSRLSGTSNTRAKWPWREADHLSVASKDVWGLYFTAAFVAPQIIMRLKGKEHERGNGATSDKCFHSCGASQLSRHRWRGTSDQELQSGITPVKTNGPVSRATDCGARKTVVENGLLRVIGSTPPL
jgi:hypothetical protein